MLTYGVSVQLFDNLRRVAREVWHCEPKFANDCSSGGMLKEYDI